LAALSPDEEQAIELNREFVGGQEHRHLTSGLPLRPKEFDFTYAELARSRAALDNEPAYGVNADRESLITLAVERLSQHPPIFLVTELGHFRSSAGADASGCLLSN
jgi:hypothetical protein